MKDNSYAFFQGNAPELSYSSNARTPSLMPELHTGSSQQSFNLGLNLRFDKPTFSGFSKPDSFVPQLREPVGVVGATVGALLKNESTRDAFPEVKEKWLTAMGSVSLVFSAAKIGHKISDTISDNQAAGQSDAEAHLCGVLKVMSQEIPEKMAKGYIVKGIPPYIAASVRTPALAATIPVVLPLIPKAYQGAEIMGQKISSYVDDVCHAQFK